MGELEPDDGVADMLVGTPWSITPAGSETDGGGETAWRGEAGRRRFSGAEREKEALCCVNGELDCEYARGVRSSSESSWIASMPKELTLAPLLPLKLVAELLVSNQLGERSSFLYAGLRDRSGLSLPLFVSNGFEMCGFGSECARVMGGALSNAAPELRLRRWLLEYGERFLLWLLPPLDVGRGNAQSLLSWSRNSSCSKALGEGEGSVDERELSGLAVLSSGTPNRGEGVGDGGLLMLSGRAS